MGKINRKTASEHHAHSPVHLETAWQPVHWSQRAGPVSDEGSYSLALLTPSSRAVCHQQVLQTPLSGRHCTRTENPESFILWGQTLQTSSQSLWQILTFLFQDVFLHEISVIGHATLAQAFLLVFIGYLDDKNLIHLPHCAKEHIKTSYLHFYHYKLSELSHSNFKMSMYTPE